MTAVGLIINGLSNRSASVVDELVDIGRKNNAAAIEVLDGITGLGAALDDMNAKKIDTLILAGGDGTMQAGFTDAINHERFDRMPDMVALPCGMTNVIANDCGLQGAPDKSLDNFLWRHKNGDVETTRRALMGVRSGAADPVYGFFFGAGAFHSAVQFSRSSVQSKGARRSLALIISVGSYIFKVAFDAENSIEGIEFKEFDPGAELDLESLHQTVFMTTTLNKIGSGIFPFWGEGDGAMISSMLAFPPERLLRAAPAVLRGKSKPWFKEKGYHSWRSDEMRMRFDGHYVFDGEIFDAHAGEDLVFDTRHKINFLQ